MARRRAEQEMRAAKEALEAKTAELAHSLSDNKIDGAVLTLVDLEGEKESYADKTPNRAKQGPQQK
jgi:hypothetical protein